MKTLFKGALLGGVIVFLCEMISWMALPFHEKTFKGFKDRTAVREILAKQAPEKGMYLLSYENLENQNLTSEEKKEKMNQQYEQMEKGPFALTVMSPHGTGAMPVAMTFSLLLKIAGAFLLTWLLIKAQIADYAGRVAFSAIFGLAAGLLGSMPNWIWWGFPLDYVILEAVDMFVSWTLSGILLARITAVKAG